MENKPPLKIAVLTESINKLEEAYPNGEVQDSNEFGKLFMGGISTPIYPISRLRKIDTAYILESEHERILNKLKEEMPWNSLFKDGWRICGMNHYNLKGKPHLFVSMTKGNLCITSESEDENSIWSDLKAKAELLTTK